MFSEFSMSHRGSAVHTSEHHCLVCCGSEPNAVDTESGLRCDHGVSVNQSCS